MSVSIVLTILAVGAFALALLDKDSGKGVPAGLLFLTLALAL